ncbi:MAG: hypothetical protein WC521_00570 [Bdellovibrionales bacterium]|jgi:hypothetical protein
MRIWEFEDKKETPSDLVREQDFILRVRRMQRASLPYLVLNFILTAIEPLAKNTSAMELAQNKLKAFASTTNGSFCEMSNGDVFLTWENPGEARLMAARAIEAALEEYKANANVFLLIYRMPENYSLLRERTNAYIEEVRARMTVSPPADKVDETKGQLTAKSVDQIQHLIEELEIRRYGRTQRIYQDNNGVWAPIAEEYFISFEDLRRERFPKVEVAQSEHLFFSICGMLDQKLLSSVTSSFSAIAGRTINFNLSITTIMGSVFTQFVRAVPHDQRKLIGFELNCGDLIQDFLLTLTAIDVLHREGFRVIIDSVIPQVAVYLDLGKFVVDSIKINVSKDRILQLTDPSIYKKIKELPVEKLIFFHCDNDRALALGREMGVAHFQGWLIDDLVAKKKI